MLFGAAPTQGAKPLKARADPFPAASGLCSRMILLLIGLMETPASRTWRMDALERWGR